MHGCNVESASVSLNIVGISSTTIMAQAEITEYPKIHKLSWVYIWGNMAGAAAEKVSFIAYYVFHSSCIASIVCNPVHKYGRAAVYGKGANVSHVVATVELNNAVKCHVGVGGGLLHALCGFWRYNVGTGNKF